MSGSMPRYSASRSTRAKRAGSRGSTLTCPKRMKDSRIRNESASRSRKLSSLGIPDDHSAEKRRAKYEEAGSRVARQVTNVSPPTCSVRRSGAAAEAVPSPPAARSRLRDDAMRTLAPCSCWTNGLERATTPVFGVLHAGRVAGKRAWRHSAQAARCWLGPAWPTPRRCVGRAARGPRG